MKPVFSTVKLVRRSIYLYPPLLAYSLMQRFLLLWLLLIILPCFAEARPEPPEALLKRRLATQPADTGRVRQLASLCFELHDSAPIQALRYGEQAADLARQLNDQPGLLRSLLVLSSCYANLSDGPHALLLQQQALDLARRLRNPDGIVRSYTGMGGVHHERNDTASALLNYRRALALAYQPGVQPHTQLLLFGNLGNLYFSLNNHEEGLLYTRRALQLARRTGDVAGESLYLADMGSYYQQLNQLNTAEGLIRQSITLLEPLDLPRFEAGNLELLASVLIQKKKLTEAETLTRQALGLARQIDYKEGVLEAYKLLAEIHAAWRQFGKAFEWQIRFRDLNDSLNSRSRLHTLAALQTRYETAEKEYQIRLLTERGRTDQRHNRELWGAVALLLLGLGGMAVLYLQLRQSRTALAKNNEALQEATRELRELAASKDRLYAIVAHDLRGPVTSFAGVTELIDFYLQRGDEQGLRRLPDMVRQAAQNLNSLLDNLLNWAVSQTGELAFRPARLPVSDLLVEMANLYSSSAEAKQIAFHIDYAPGLAVWADPHMTRTVLRNFIGNALKFTPANGSIYLRADAPTGAIIRLSVTDTGPGMSAEQVVGLLDAKNPRLPIYGPRSGTGLGLLLCRAFAIRQGGALHITSAPGQGTSVSVTLPAARHE